MSGHPNRKIIYLVLEGLAPDRLAELQLAAQENAAVEIFPLTETNGHAALEKIFAADSISVWGALQ